MELLSQNQNQLIQSDQKFEKKATELLSEDRLLNFYGGQMDEDLKEALK